MSNGYVPGVSQAQFGVGLGMDTRQAEKDAQSQARKLNKYGAKRGFLGKLGGKALDFLGTKGLTTALAGAGLGPLAPFLAKAITKGGGQLLGSSKLFSGSGPEITGSSTGLNPNEIFSKLRDVKGGMDASFAGQALGTAGAQLRNATFGDEGPLSLAKGLGFGNEVPQGLENMEDIVSQAKGSDVYQTALGFNTGGFATSQMTEIPKGLLAGLRREEKPSAVTRSNPSSYIDDLLISRDSRERALAELGGMKHADSARKSEDIYQKSLVDMDYGKENLDSLRQLTRQAKNIAKPEGSRYYTDTGEVDIPRQMQRPEYQQKYQPEALPQMKNPFTGEELSELKTTDIPQGLQDLIPAGTYTGDEFNFSIPEEGMQQYLQGQTGDKGIVDALEFANRKPDRSLMDKLLGKNKPREAQEGDAGRLRKLMGDENYFMMPDRKYEDEIQQLLKGFQMGGMPGVSSPIPYQGGGEAEIDPRIMARRIRGDVYSRSGLYDVDYDEEGVMKGARLKKELKGQPGYENWSDMIDNINESVINAEKDFYSNRGGYPVVGTSSPTNPLVKSILKGEGYFDEMKQQGGYMQQYNLGGSVSQQPMSYQLGGLLKYKRNPMVG